MTTKVQLVDIGANLAHEAFADDFNEIITNAQEAKLCHIIITGTDLATSKTAQLLASERPQFLSSTVGFHPHIAKMVTQEQLQTAERLIQFDHVVAIGETGLDFNRNYSSQEDQLRIFEYHLELATKIDKPLFLHQRDAHETFFPMLKKYRHQISGGVIHCFTDTADALRDYLELDMYIGITGWICDERRGQDLQQLVNQIPLNRLLIETDAPYLLPRTLKPRPRSRRNEPAHLIEVAKTIALFTEHSLQEVVDHTCSNARALFKLPIEDTPLKHPYKLQRHQSSQIK